MGFFRKTKVFGRPIRKVKVTGATAAVVTGLVWVDQIFGLGLGEEVLSDFGEVIVATAVLWIPIIQTYLVRSDPRDVENIPR